MIQINEDYRVVSDPYCFILQKRSVPLSGKLEGEDLWNAVSYHKDLPAVFKKFFEIDSKLKVINGDSRVSIEEALKKIEQVGNKIAKAVSDMQWEDAIYDKKPRKDVREEAKPKNHKLSRKVG